MRASPSTPCKDDAPALELIRHDLAHIMARAVQEIWPDVKVTIGPVRDKGWYYDFDRAEPFVPEDLAGIEKRRCARSSPRAIPCAPKSGTAPARSRITRRERTLQGRADRIDPRREPLRMYWHGHWQDLCRGPPSATHRAGARGCLQADVIAGAYWLGDSTRAPCLQRIYGVAFRTRDDLKAHLTMLEEAAKRDHRKLGREMDLFHMQEEAPGRCSGTRTAGASTPRCKITCAASSAAAMSR
jgi:threonyl-tRNA synthetase